MKKKRKVKRHPRPKGSVCLDANVYLCPLTYEPQWSLCITLLERLDDGKTFLYEPVHIVSDVASILRKKIMLNQITQEEANKALELFCERPILLKWEPSLLSRTLVLSEKLNFKNTSAASYLAVAEKARIPFITLDEEFIKKVKPLYPKVYGVEEFLKGM